MVKVANKEELVRLNVLLQEFGVSSRRKADELIESGAVQVNGKIIRVLGTKIERQSSISVNGKVLKNIPAKVTYILNKPFMTITSRKDDKERATIFDLPEIKKLPLNVQSVGRLDYRSEGLLVLTNDGDLALALSHPKYSVEKTYAVLTSSAFTVEDSEKLKKGIELDDGPAKAISVKIGGKEKLGNSVGQWIELVVTEGRNRLVRRMMEALGLSVVRLVRVAIGDLRLPGKLEPGKMRIVSDIEAKYLNDIKKSMINEESKKKKTPNALSKDVTEKRKIKRKLTLNDTDYAREAERREKRASLVASLRKKETEKIKEEKRSAWHSNENAKKDNKDKKSYFTKEKKEEVSKNKESKRSSVYREDKVKSEDKLESKSKKRNSKKDFEKKPKTSSGKNQSSKKRYDK
ncbi:pseudouridine synthase [Silvanigrella paludirubra]|uniref:Pseudouridine synthase n=1 Tax=Silvanigrella paludirubra TaxID=2499159 RepID=A0A6N6VVP3_9BACT|nr:pseudouridine synthase [Silvanigrella paludirubra]KAB8039477.1 pseudouridine synthase [Silvanigrella paludirubra]